jgi:DNA-binding NtrC family response regulator
VSSRESDPTAVRRAGAGSPARSARFVVVALEGPDRGASVAVDPSLPSRVLAGKSEACALRLTDPLVSRRHAAFAVAGSELHVSDCRSTNGTFVNGVRVTEAFLRGGEVITIGQSKLRAVPAGDVAEAASGPTSFGPLLGGSVPMLRLYPMLARLAATDVPVVIEGETGTGKEVAAEAIHAQGPRADGPFVVFDCTAVTASLMEAALFGHEKGAFTGAATAHRGVFEEAHGGTLLIDEIGDLDPALQPKLLRAVQRREVKRVGGERWIKVDVRVLAATRRDLDREVAAGRFREDLFYRLAVARVELPPLRERTGDVSRLAQAFWDRLGGRGQPIDPEVLAAWEDHPWPGNVRELENTVARRLALGELAPPLGLARREPPPTGTLALPFDPGRPLAVVREAALAELERRYVQAVLAAHDGRAAEAAAHAGVTRRYLNMLRVRFGV